MNEMFSYAPMFSRNPGPAFRGMFNMPGNPLMQMAGQMFSSQLASQYGMMPLQFFPEQSAYDQLLAMQMYNQQQSVANRAARFDAAQLQQVLGGAMQLATRQPLNLAQQQQTVQMSQQLSSFTPMLAPIIGTRMLDDLYGQAGSAVAMSMALNRGMRTLRDPISGALGASTATGSAITGELFSSLYGTPESRAAMRGIKAGAAGELFEELAYRGLSGPLSEHLSLTERAAAASRLDMSDARVNRLAENTQFIQDIRARGLTPSAADYSTAAGQVRSTFSQLGKLPENTTAADLAKLPGAEDLLRAGDAERIAGRLRNLSGAVAAMREIFGDMGEPDAPMRKIINGLNDLTQGGLAMMSPATLEKTVRSTQALARQTGIDMQSFMGLTAQAAGMADRLHLDRGAALPATQRAVAFGGAAQERARLDLPTFGGLSLEEMTLLDQQLQMTGQASPVANQLNATMRMAEAGMFAPDSIAGRMAQAIREKKTDFAVDAEGKVRRSLGMNSAEWRQLMLASGVQESAVQAMQADRYGNQMYGQKYDTGEMTRALQAEVDIRPKVAASFQAALAGGLTQGGIADTLKAAGFSPEHLTAVSRQASLVLAKQFEQAAPETYRDPAKMREYMVNATQAAIADSVRKQAMANGMDGGAAEQLAAKAMQDSALLRSMGLSTLPQLNRTIQLDPSLSPLKSYVGLAQMFGGGGELLRGARNRLIESETTAAMTAAYAGLGTDGPLGRLTEALRTADASTPLTHVLARFAGGIPMADLAQKNPQLQALLEQTQRFEHADRDAAGTLTDAGRTSRMDAAANTAALVAGGSQAAARRMELWKLRGGNVADVDTYEQSLDAKIAAAQTEAERKALLQERQLVMGLRVAAGDAGGVEQLLRSAGYATDTRVSAATVDTAMQYGEQLGTGAVADQQKNAQKFLSHAQSIIDTLGTSPSDMSQLGNTGIDASGAVKLGGRDLVEQLRLGQSELLQLGQKHKRTPAEVLAGVAGPAAQRAAMEIRNRMLQHLTTIRDIKGTQLMPGAAGRTDGRTALSPAELQALQEESDFQLRQFSGSPTDVEKQQAQYLAEQWRDKLGTADGRTFLTETVADTIQSQGAGLSVFRAMRANDQLRQLVAKERKLDLSKMTVAQQETAVQSYLTDAAKSPGHFGAVGQEAASLAKQAELVRGAESSRQILERLRGVHGTTARDRESATAAKSDKLAVTGKLTLMNMKEAILDGVGIGTAGGVDFAVG